MTSLTEEYLAAVNRPAQLVHDFRVDDAAADGVEILDGRAFVLARVLTETECDHLIQAAEAHGIEASVVGTGSARSAKRTSKYGNEGLSQLVSERIESTLSPKFLETDANYLGPFAGTHCNWRVLRYDPGDCFPPHQDQMDTLQQMNEDGTKELIVSSHTLLINLKGSERGGATRFYPRAKIKGTNLGQYDYAVDVILPRGWAIAFEQKGLVHCGQPVLEGTKFVAQAGVLRKVPPGKLIQPSVFRVGPGIKALADDFETRRQQEKQRGAQNMPTQIQSTA